MSDLFESNRAAFAAHAPDIAAKIERHQPSPQLRLVRKGGGFNAEINGSRFYTFDMPAGARPQVEDFARRPEQINVQVDLANQREFVFVHPDDVALLERAEAFLADHATQEIRAGEPRPSGGRPFGYFALIGGIGLGHHLPLLLEELECREVLLFEPIFDLFYLSLSCFDWQAWFDRCEERGVTFRFFFGSDPMAAVWQFAVPVIRHRCCSGVDGSFFYFHYRHPFFDELYRQTGAALFRLVTAWGFFQDERIQIENTLGNLRDLPQRRFLEPPVGWRAATPNAPLRLPGGSKGSTVVLVGSGPSLKDRLDEIRAIRDRVTLVSCGSGLMPLLEAGIAPHLHVMKERDPEGELLLDPYRGVEGFDAMTVLISVSTDPPYFEVFARNPKVLFLRGVMAVEHLLAGAVVPVEPAGNAVDSFAIPLVAAAGARRVVFVGMDLGSRDPDRHHVDTAVHYRDDFVPTYASMLGQTSNLSRTVPANFGGTVHTNDRFNDTRIEHESFIARLPEIQWLNASDGALIKGAKPLRDLEALDDPAGGPAAFLESLARAVKTVDAGVAKRCCDLRAAVASLQDDPLSARIRVALKGFREQGRPPGNGGGDVLSLVADYFTDPDLPPVVEACLSGEAHEKFLALVMTRRTLVSDADRHAYDALMLEGIADSLERCETELIAALSPFA